MKKAFLIITLALLTGFSSFAGFQSTETWWFNGFDENGAAQVNNSKLIANINSYVDYITLSYNIYYFQPGGYLDMGAYKDNTTPVFYQYIGSQSANTYYLLYATSPSSYWQSVDIYTEFYNTNGTIALNWGQI